jgi:ubiquinone/menaquinone biosynthesis C-methylase UbiE
MQEELLKPEKIIELLDIPDSSIVCDFGCGSNGWTIPLAKAVPHGMVYAVDVIDDYLGLLESNLKRKKVDNVKILLSDIEKDVKIGDKEIDLLVVANLLHQVDDPDSVMKEGARILKDGGQVVIVDWKKDNPFDISDRVVDFDKLKESILKIGFKIEKELDAGAYHRCLIIKKEKHE